MQRPSPAPAQEFADVALLHRCVRCGEAGHRMQLKIGDDPFELTLCQAHEDEVLTGARLVEGT